MHSGYFKGKTKKYIVIQKRLKACRKKVKVKSFSHVRLFVTPWTVAHQALPSMGFSRQEYWSGLLFPSLGDLPNPETKSMSPPGFLTTEPPGKPFKTLYSNIS